MMKVFFSLPIRPVPLNQCRRPGEETTLNLHISELGAIVIKWTSHMSVIKPIQRHTRKPSVYDCYYSSTTCVSYLSHIFVAHIRMHLYYTHIRLSYICICVCIPTTVHHVEAQVIKDSLQCGRQGVVVSTHTGDLVGYMLSVLKDL